MSATIVSLSHVAMEFPAIEGVGSIRALDDVNVDFLEDEFVVALGASGCGKTTLLNVIAGFLSPTSGEILHKGIPVTGPGRDRGVVFQKHALLPWLNVVENTEFGLKLQRVAGRRASNQGPREPGPRRPVGFRALSHLPTFGRDAAASGARAGTYLRPGHAAHGRAARRPRCLHPGEHAGAHPRRVEEDQKGRVLHYPQRRRGVVHGDPARRDVAAAGPDHAPSTISPSASASSRPAMREASSRRPSLSRCAKRSSRSSTARKSASSRHEPQPILQPCAPRGGPVRRAGPGQQHRDQRRHDRGDPGGLVARHPSGAHSSPLSAFPPSS